MPETHRALDWLARRHAGESAAYVAHHAGVSEGTVLRATRDYGPFPRPSTQLGRTTASDEQLDARARRWVQQRRRGHAVKDIAARSEVAHQVVSRATVGHGPYPAVDVVEGWVEQRRAGRSLAVLAAAEGIAPAVVRRHTAPYGPFPPPRPRLPDGVVGVAGIAARLGLSDPSVARWRRTGRLPAPDFVTARGRPLWLEGTVGRWLDDLDAETCPDCGARCLSVSRHRTGAHRVRA